MIGTQFLRLTDSNETMALKSAKRDTGRLNGQLLFVKEIIACCVEHCSSQCVESVCGQKDEQV